MPTQDGQFQGGGEGVLEPEGALGFSTQRVLNVASTFQGRTPKEGRDGLSLGTGEPTVQSMWEGAESW